MIGIALGQFTGSISRGNTNGQIAISTGVSLVCCFCSGLMIGDMKNRIESFAPILNRINPAALISDAFYSLTVYDDLQRYIQCIISICLIAAILIFTSYHALRRVRYERI